MLFRSTGIVGRVFRRLVTALEQGKDLRAAISSNREALPREAQAYAATGAIQLAQPEQATWTLESSSLTWHPLLQRSGYIGVILVIMLCIVAFVMIRIVPSYQAIFDDFDLELPQLTTGLISISSAIVSTHLFTVVLTGYAIVVLLGILAVIL